MPVHLQLWDNGKVGVNPFSVESKSIRSGDHDLVLEYFSLLQGHKTLLKWILLINTKGLAMSLSVK